MMSVLKLRNQDLLIDHASPTAMEETQSCPVYPPGRYYPAYHHPTEVKTEPEPLMAWDDSNQADDVQSEGGEVVVPESGPVKKRRKPVNLTIKCPVCGGPAPDHVHFGGQCCYSCRAFFRRTAHRPVSSFRCRGGKASCTVTSGTKSCIPCRLRQCLKVGMDPSLVRGRKPGRDGEAGSPAGAEQDHQQFPPYPVPPTQPSDLSQGSWLRFNADLLKYQGLRLQYQARLLENQASLLKTRMVAADQEAEFDVNNMREGFQIGGYKETNTSGDDGERDGWFRGVSPPALVKKNSALTPNLVMNDQMRFSHSGRPRPFPNIMPQRATILVSPQGGRNSTSPSSQHSLTPPSRQSMSPPGQHSLTPSGQHSLPPLSRISLSTPGSSYAATEPFAPSCISPPTTSSMPALERIRRPPVLMDLYNSNAGTAPTKNNREMMSMDSLHKHERVIDTFNNSLQGVQVTQQQPEPYFALEPKWMPRETEPSRNEQLPLDLSVERAGGSGLGIGHTQVNGMPRLFFKTV